MLQRNAAHPD